MVITPKDAKKLTEEQQEEADTLESVIDCFITEEWPGKHIARIPLNDAQQPPCSKVQRYLKSKYVAAGWKGLEICYGSEQGEGVICMLQYK